MTIRCTASRFDSLLNPYTGEPLMVHMVTNASAPLFFCPGTYSPSQWFPTEAETIAAYRRVNGVPDTRPPSDFRCAYTGRPLTLESGPLGFRLSGGFDPRRMWSDVELLHYASMRDGVSSVPLLATTRVESPAESFEQTADSKTDSGPDNDMLREAEKVVTKFADSVGIEKSPSVCMYKSSKKRKRK